MPPPPVVVRRPAAGGVRAGPKRKLAFLGGVVPAAKKAEPGMSNGDTKPQPEVGRKSNADFKKMFLAGSGDGGDGGKTTTTLAAADAVEAKQAAGEKVENKMEGNGSKTD
jgi:hypothetical protein